MSWRNIGPALAICCVLTSTVSAAPGGKTVLTAEDFWRKHYTYLPPRVSAASAEAHGLPTDADARAKAIAKYVRTGLQSPPPAAGWAGRDFDDAGWPLLRGRQFVSASGGYSQMGYVPHSHNDPVFRCTDPFVPEIGMVCQRGFLRVKDRSKVKSLSLSLTYRGGYVARLNGVEVARGHLPDGEIAPETPGADYGVDAWLVGDGQRKGNMLHWWQDKESKQWLVRERSAGPIAIRPGLLRDGLNVLAVELHRSDYPVEALRRPDSGMAALGFSPVGLSVLELSAEAPEGAVESLHPQRQGVQVWNAEVDRAVGPAECANWDARLEPIRLTAARNGRFSGQVVVTAEGPIGGLASQVGAFAHESGKGGLPASAATVHYGAVNPVQRGIGLHNIGLDYLSAVVPPDSNFGKTFTDPAAAMCRRFDLLLEAPPAEAASVPVWVTVHVPANAAAGRYTSRLTVRVAGQDPVAVPVELTVADWTLPDVADRVSLFQIYQSPDTLAAYYKVAPWSAEHWRLIEQSLKLMGENGSIALIIPLLAESQMGNVDSMVLWKPKGRAAAPATAPAIPVASGEYEHDFAIFDRYLKTALKHHRRLKYLFVLAWGIEVGRKEPHGGYVTVVDGDGNKVLTQLPRFDSPECEAMWRPLLQGLTDHAGRAGFRGKLLLGMPADCQPPPSHLQMFRRAAPDYGWMHESHMRIGGFRYGGRDEVIPVTYQSMVYTNPIPDPATMRCRGWRHSGEPAVVGFNRFGFGPLCLLGFPAPGSFRVWFETNLVSDRGGAGRVGGDYWNIGAQYKGGPLTSWAGGGMRETLFGSYAHSQVGQVGMANNTTDLLGPGPDGAVTTVRFENACEGIQLAEARIFIEKALIDPARRLPEDLAARCLALLDLRTNVLRGMSIPGGRDRDRRLFDLAGEVAAALSAARKDGH